MRLSSGFTAIATFAAAGVACTWRGVPDGIYVVVSLVALALFGVALFVPDDRWPTFVEEFLEARRAKST